MLKWSWLIQGRLRCDRDALSCGDSGKDWQAVVSEFLDIELDAFADQGFNFFARLSRDTQAWKIGGISSPPAIFTLFENNQVFAHRLLQARLFQDTLQGSFGNIFRAVIGDNNGSWFARMLIDVMASATAFQEPTILLNPLYDLAIFQFFTAPSLQRREEQANRLRREATVLMLLEWERRMRMLKVCCGSGDE